MVRLGSITQKVPGPKFLDYGKDQFYLSVNIASDTKVLESTVGLYICLSSKS